MSRTIEMTLEILDQIRCIEDKIVEVDREETIKIKFMREVGADIEKGSIQKILEGMTSSSSRSRSGSRASTNRGRIRCYKCREYDHFTKDCLTSKLEKETEKYNKCVTCMRNRHHQKY